MSRQADWQKRKLAAGRCPCCGKPKPRGGHLCAACRARSRERMRVRLGAGKPARNGRWTIEERLLLAATSSEVVDRWLASKPEGRRVQVLAGLARRNLSPANLEILVGELMAGMESCVGRGSSPVTDNPQEEAFYAGIEREVAP